MICVTMTGFSTMDTAIEALRLGIDEFILKPFSPDELASTIAKALEKERLRKENFRLRSLIPLFELNKTLMGTVDVATLLQQLLQISKKETNATFAALYTTRPEQIVTHFATEPAVEDCDQQTASNTLAQRIFEEGQQVHLSQTATQPEQLELLQQLKVQYLLATPLKSKETNLGVLILGRTQQNFASSDSEFISVLAGQASVALENAHLFSEIQAAYKELKKLDHMKSEFINIAAHELRTPLAILMGYASMLEDDLEGMHKDYVSTIIRNSLRLSTLIDEMLSLQSLESGAVSLAQDQLRLAEVVQSALSDLSLWIAEKKLAVAIEIPGDFPQMIADRQKFDLIILNLIDNAVKFTPSGGRILLNANSTPTDATITITNTGISIPHDKLQRVFEPFFQVESSLTREHGGLGLGLAVVRGMVEVCGGKIHASSEEGQSTSFTFTLPLDNSHLKDRILRL
jgi:signal transduction histidine kinase